MVICLTPGCPKDVPRRGRCDTCEQQRRRMIDRNRGSASSRGYGRAWARKRRQFLKRYSICDLCGMPATDVDHYPQSRRELIRAGVGDPDASDYLRPLCHQCHSKHTYAGGGRW